MKTSTRRCLYAFFALFLVSSAIWLTLYTLASLQLRAKTPATDAREGGSFQKEDRAIRMIQGAMDEQARSLRVLLNARSDASFPKVTAVSCPKLWSGDFDEAYLNKSKAITRPNVTYWSRDSRDLEAKKSSANATTSAPPPYDRVLEMTLNCTRYVLEGGFLLANVSEEELSFPLAFSLMVYRDLEQVERLLRAIYRPHNVYCVHVDRKSSAKFQSDLRLIVGCLPNVVMAEKAVDVMWGGIEMELQCMQRLTSHAAKWRYFINLTGQEFPLKTNKELVAIFKAFQGANDISGTTSKRFHGRYKYLKPAPYNITVTKGSKLFVASRGYVDYVMNSRVACDFLKWVNRTFLPDEQFFSTLNNNPQLGVPGSFTGNRTREEGLLSRYVVWSFYPIKCSGTFIHWVCVFGVGDLPRLTQTPNLIANKFYYNYQPIAYDCLEEWYFHKVHLENIGQPLPLNLSIYANSEIVKYMYKGPVKVW